MIVVVRIYNTKKRTKLCTFIIADMILVGAIKLFFFHRGNSILYTLNMKVLPIHSEKLGISHKKTQ